MIYVLQLPDYVQLAPKMDLSLGKRAAHFFLEPRFYHFSARCVPGICVFFIQWKIHQKNSSAVESSENPRLQDIDHLNLSDT